MESNTYTDFFPQINNLCKVDQDGNKCAELCFQKSTLESAFIYEGDVEGMLECLKFEDYKKGCFYIG